MSRFAINIYANDSGGTFLQDVGPIAEQVRISTLLNGGCGQLVLRVPHPTFVIPNYVGPNYRVDILDDQAIFWAGRMERFVATTDQGGEYWEITARGYAINGDDQLYASQDVSNTITSTIISNVLTNLMPQIGATSVSASGYTLSGVTAITLKMMKGSQVIGWATGFGDSTNNPQQWYVYPDADRTIRFTLEDRPTTVGVYLSVRHLASYTFGFDLAHYANKVTVQYNVAAATVTVNNLALQGVGPAGINLIREALLIYDQVTQSVDATQLANAELTRLSAQRMAATTLILNPDAVPLDGTRTPIPLWRVRSGKLCQLEDITAAGANTSLTFNNSFLIVGTEFDEDQQSLTIIPESHETFLQYETARARRLLEGRHTVNT